VSGDRFEIIYVALPICKHPVVDKFNVYYNQSTPQNNQQILIINNFNNCLSVCIFYKLYEQVLFYVLPVGISQMAIWHFNFDMCAF
jgi:hypothetical protein